MLIELVVLLPLLGILGTAVSTLFISQIRLARRTQGKAGSAEVIRLGTGVLRAELRWLRFDRDLVAWSADSIRLRAFRGVAVPCSRRLDGPLRVHGLRLPDPEKDSVLVVGSTQETVHRLVAIRDTALACSGNADGQVWTLDPVPTTSGVLLAFEIGTYSVGDAVRYRIGNSGRQPLTEALLDAGSSGFLAHARVSGAGPTSFTLLLTVREYDGRRARNATVIRPVNE